MNSKSLIREVLAFKKVTNRDLAELTGIREQNISEMLSGRRTLTDKSLAKFSEALEIPFETLKKSEELQKFLVGGAIPRLQGISQENFEKLNPEDQKKFGFLYRGNTNSKKNDNTKTLQKEDNLFDPEKTKLYLSQLPEKEAELYIPYYDVEITAGILELFFDDVDEQPEGYIYAPQYIGCIACNVKGDSMYDMIYPGSRLYVQYLKNKKYIDFGQTYLVVLDGYRLLKYIKAHPTDDTKVILSSHNKRYDDWAVEKADILHLFLVKGYENQNAN